MTNNVRQCVLNKSTNTYLDKVNISTKRQFWRIGVLTLNTWTLRFSLSIKFEFHTWQYLINVDNKARLIRGKMMQKIQMSPVHSCTSVTYFVTDTRWHVSDTCNMLTILFWSLYYCYHVCYHSWKPHHHSWQRLAIHAIKFRWQGYDIALKCS